MNESVLLPTWETSECLLCDVVNNETWVPYCLLFPSEEPISQIILETHSFVVVPDIAPIVDGYCLIISKRHTPAMAHLRRDELNELDLLEHCLKQVLRQVYGKVIIFEHGELTFTKNAGACIDHAHLHFAPLSQDLILDKTNILFTKIDLSNRWEQLSTTSGYLYFENQNDEAFFSLVTNCEQQFFRRRLAITSGSNLPWNWRDYIRYANIFDTGEKIKNCIKKVKGPLVQLWMESSQQSLNTVPSNK